MAENPCGSAEAGRGFDTTEGASRRESGMLRVTRNDAESGATLMLEGKLSGPWVDELQKYWAASRQAPIRVSLKEVTYVDGRGRDLLIRMEREGASLVEASDFIRHLLSENVADEGHSPTTSRKS